MTNPILLGMACEYTRKLEPCSDLSGFDQTSAMSAALQWLADNVSDEMLNAFFNAKDRSKNNREAISAALRAAAGGEK